MAEIFRYRWTIPVDFRKSRVLLCFLSYHHCLCSVRTRCSAHQRDSQSHDPFQGELSSKWKEKQNKQEGKRWEIRGINPYLFLCGWYLSSHFSQLPIPLLVLPIFQPDHSIPPSHWCASLPLTVTFPGFSFDLQTGLLPFPQCFLLLTPHCLLPSSPWSLLISYPSSVIFSMSVCSV